MDNSNERTPITRDDLLRIARIVTGCYSQCIQDQDRQAFNGLTLVLNEIVKNAAKEMQRVTASTAPAPAPTVDKDQGKPWKQAVAEAKDDPRTYTSLTRRITIH